MEYIKKIWQSAKEFWKSKNRSEKIRMLTIALGSLAIISTVIFFLTRPTYVPLYTNLDIREAGEVVKKLDGIKIKYELADAGKTIMVAPEDKYKTRLQLAQEGLPKGGLDFNDVMDKTKLGTTEWEKQLQYNQALQSELKRTIESMEEVDTASVHLVQQDKSNFLNINTTSKPTAAVVLKLIPGFEMKDEQVLGIVNLISHSVRGLDPENVTIIDGFGRVLSNISLTPGEDSKETINTQLAIQNNLQQQLQANVQSLLEQIYGVGNVVVRVNAQLNFDKKVVENRMFSPVNEETGEGILRSTQELKEHSSGTNSAPMGVPGVDANVPPTYQQLTEGESEQSRSEAVKNYEINETLENLAIAPGAVEKVSVSVVVNKDLNDGEKLSIANMVARAVGGDPQKDVSVEGIEFANDFVKSLHDLTDFQQRQAMMRNYILIGIAFLLFVVFIASRVILSRRKKRQEEDIIAKEFMASQDEAAATRSIEDEIESDQIFTEIQKYARRRPEDVSKVLRTWLDED